MIFRRQVSLIRFRSAVALWTSMPEAVVYENSNFVSRKDKIPVYQAMDSSQRCTREARRACCLGSLANGREIHATSGTEDKRISQIKLAASDECTSQIGPQ
jgi:hypothetical protein